MKDQADPVVVADLFNTDKGFRKIHEDFLKDMMSPCNHVFIDLPLMVDYKLGAIMYMFKDDPVKFQYICDIIMTTYSDLIGKHITPKFPELGITEGVVIDFLVNPDNAYVLSRLSPATNLNILLTDFILDLFISNCKFNTEKDSIINIYFNNPYFQLADESKASIKNLLMNVNCKLFFIEDEFYVNKGIEVSEFLFIDDFTTFSSSPIVKTMFKQEFIDKTISTVYMSDLNGAMLKDEETAKFFKDIHTHMNERCDFKFMYKYIPIMTDKDKTHGS